jgi:putative membrane protein
VHGPEAAASRRRQAKEEIAMNIKTDTTRRARIPLAAAVVLVLGLVACDRRDVEDDATVTPAEPTATREAGTPPTDADRDVEAPTATNAPEPPDATAEMPAGSAATGTTQADALAMLMTVDEHEIAAADQALGKNVTGAVRDFAQMMKTDHGKNLTDTTKLGGAASTAPAVKTLKDKGDADLRALDAQSGKAYEKAYIDAMVKGHTDALAMIDNTLLPAATDPNIRQHFTTTRAAVARHLEKAKEIQGTLK